MKISKNIISKLLEKIGFSVAHDHNWIIITHNDHIVYLNNKPYFKTYKSLFYMLTQSKKFMYFTYATYDWEFIDNLYYNCKSLEEMMIKADLML